LPTNTKRNGEQEEEEARRREANETRKLPASRPGGSITMTWEGKRRRRRVGRGKRRRKIGGKGKRKV
jgi:hypothetical protein